MQPKPTSQAMKDTARWLAWKYGEPNAKGKCPKVPYNPRSGLRCDPTNPDNWTTHSEAAALASGQGFDGLGFALGDGWQGIDFDGVDANGLADLVNAAPGYVEYSPTGAGAHAIGFGQPFTTLASNASGLEAYSGGRYFTFTGNAFRDDPMTDLAPFVAQAIAPRHGAGKAAPAAPPALEQADPLDASTAAQLADALDWINPDARESWIAVIAALKSVPNNSGFELARDWSRRSSKHDDAEFAAKWAENWKHSSYRAVFSMAQANGWQNPGWRQDVELRPHGLAAFDPRTGQGVETPFPATLNLTELLRIVQATPPRLFTTTFFTPCGEVTLLSADGGVGKTNFALAWALCLAFGMSGLSLHIPAPVPVLFVTAEDDAIECGRRLEAIAAAMHLNFQGEWLSEGFGRLHLWDIEGSPLWVEARDSAAGVATAALAELERRIITTGAKQVFIDNASTVFLADHNALVPVNAFIGALRRIAARTECNILLLAHVNAETATKGSGKTYNGSVAWNNSVRSRMFMKVVVETDLPEHIIVSHEKANLGPKSGPFRLRRNAETGVLSAFTNHEVAAAIDETSAPMVEKVFGHIQEAQRRGEPIRAAASGPKTAYHGLAEIFPREYAEGDKEMKRRVKLAISTLSNNGRIVKRNGWDNNRNTHQFWAVLTPDDPLYGAGV